MESSTATDKRGEGILGVECSQESGEWNTRESHVEEYYSTGTTGASGISNAPGSTTENGSAAGTTTGNSQSPSGGTNASGTDTSGAQSSNVVKTGDNTVILPFVILIAAAIIVVIIIVVVMIRKKDKEN